MNTPRNSEQQKALTSVNHLIDGVIQKMQDDLSMGKEVCNLLYEKKAARLLAFQASVLLIPYFSDM